MKPAEEIQQVRKDVWFWQAYDPAVKADLSSCAIETADGLVILDPIPLAPAPMEELVQLRAQNAVEGARAMIVLTNANHLRAAAEFSARLQAPIFASAETAAELQLTNARVIGDEDEITAGLVVISLPGFGPGEIALHTPQHGGAIFIGDALINFGSNGFSQLPAKYCANAKLARQSLQKLLRFDFGLMTFAHGLPIAADAKPRLLQLLA